MIRQLTEGIAKALYAEFGDACTIYTESIEQDLEVPCFLITCVRPKQELFLGRRYLREQLFLIQYFPKSRAEPRQECMEVQDRLYDALEYISDGEQLRYGTGMEGEVTDDLLHFEVQYNFFTIKAEEEEGPLMETLAQEMEVRR